MIASDFDDARILALMHAYLDAEYRCELEGQWHGLEIGQRALALEAAFPEGREFGLLSAWNPLSVERPEADNRAADEALQATLEAKGIACRPAFASARNRSWREPCWIVADLPLADFDALARRFGQLATLHARRGEPLRLRMLWERPTALLPDAVEAESVDWVDLAVTP